MELRYDPSSDTLLLKLREDEEAKRSEPAPGVTFISNAEDQLVALEIVEASRKVENPATAQISVSVPSQTSRLAADLLELEAIYHDRGCLDREQADRWRELTEELFGEDPFRRNRRSYRMTVRTSARVEIGGREFECQIEEISRVGMRLQGEAFSIITHEDSLRLLEVDLAGTRRSLDLRCRIVYLDRSIAGIEVSSDNGEDALQAYFRNAYYPCYVRYLERVARGGSAPS